MSSEKFCLKWNDFESNISGAFRDLRDDKDFFDVTLSCDDEQIEAHKVIISACSPFFRNVLRKNPHQHPLLYMRGVSFNDLKSVLDFMYHGEVNVAQEDLNNFLSVAEDLKVKGLTQNQSGSSRQSSKPEVKSKPPDREREIKRSMSRPGANQEDDDIQEVMPVKTEPTHSQSEPFQDDHQQPGQQLQQFEDGAMEYGEGYEDYGQYDESGQLVEGGGGAEAGKGGNMFVGKTLEEACESGLERVGGGKVLCLLCHRTWPSLSHARRHLEAKHFQSEGYHCDVCDAYCRTKHALTCHISRHHK